MKDSEEITIDTFKNFIRNTLNLNLKKREEHALFVLLDTNKNNKISKDEFMALMTKGEKLLDAPPQPKVNNYLDEVDEDRKETKTKDSLYRADSTSQYSGNPKAEFIKTIHASGDLSIEEFLNSKCKWKSSDFVDIKVFRTKAKVVFPNVPDSDLNNLFNQLDVMGEKKVKVGNMIKELKNSIRNADNETKALLTIEDIEPNSSQFTPRSGGTFIVAEIKDHADRFNYTLDEIFKLAKTPGKTFATKQNLRTSMRQCLSKCSREVIEGSINFFQYDEIEYKEFLIIFDLKEVKVKNKQSSERAQQKWVKEYCDRLRKIKLDPVDIMKEADTKKDGIIDLKEFEKALKQYVKPDQLNFKDLQHILDSLDINNDGKVTIKEYETAVKKYGDLEEVDQNATTDEVVYAAKEAAKNNGCTLKEVIAL